MPETNPNSVMYKCKQVWANASVRQRAKWMRAAGCGDDFTFKDAIHDKEMGLDTVVREDVYQYFRENGIVQIAPGDTYWDTDFGRE